MTHSNYAIDLRAYVEPDKFGHPLPRYPWFMRCAAFVLMCGITCAPFTSAYADELVADVTEAPVVEVSPPEQVEVAEPEPVPELVPEPEPEPISEEVIVEEPVATTTHEVATTTEEVIPESEVVVSESVAEPEPAPEPESEVEEISPFTPEVQFPELGGKHVFKDSECAVVDDGGFYCVRSNPDEEVAHPVETDTVFVAQDGEGDTEIYVRTEGHTKKISDNVFDDDAPAVDPHSGRVSWHADVDGRYQIFVYDPGSGVHQVTRESYNSQNPSIDGNVLVWQAWSDENWEVFMTDLSRGFESPEVVRLSGTGNHDMFPKVYGTYVTWQAREGEVWRAKGMDLVTRELSDLGEGTGGDVQSARLVLLVERRNATGDIVQVGYDIDSGETIALGSKAPEPTVPESLPSPYDEPSAIPPPVQTSTTTPQRDEPLPAEPEPEVTA